MKEQVNSKVSAIKTSDGRLKYSISSLLNLKNTASQSIVKRKVMLDPKIMCNEQTYYRWLRIPFGSKSKIPYEALQIFSAELGVSIDELFVTAE